MSRKDIHKQIQAQIGLSRSVVAEKEETIEQYRVWAKQCKRNVNPSFAEFLNQSAIPDLEKDVRSLKEKIEELSTEYRNYCFDMAGVPEFSEESESKTDEQFWADIDRFIDERLELKRKREEIQW